MASTIWRLTSLCVIFAIVLVGFGIKQNLATAGNTENIMELSENERSEVPNLDLCPVGDNIQNMAERLEMPRYFRTEWYNQQCELSHEYFGKVQKRKLQIKKLKIALDKQNQESIKLNKTLIRLNRQVEELTNILLETQNLELKRQNETIVSLNEQVDELMNNLTTEQNTLELLVKYFNERTDIDFAAFINNENTKECKELGYGHYYHGDQTCIETYENFNKNWTVAREYCKTLNGDLVIIRDEKKEDFLDSILKPNLGYVIGIVNENKKVQDFKYVDGSPLTAYQNWNPDYPQIYDDQTFDCVYKVQNDGGLWKNLDCAWPFPFVCSTSKPSFY